MEYFAYSQKEFVYKYVVMLTDTDQFQHMSFANYLKLMFLATDALLQPALDRTFLSKNRLSLRHSRFQFKRQSAPGANLLVKINASGIDGRRFSLLYTFLIEGTADLVGLGRQSFESVTLEGDSAEALPDEIQKLLCPIQREEEHLLYPY